VRLQLAPMLKLHMVRMRQRTCTESRSITLVVRRRWRCAGGSRNIEKRSCMSACKIAGREERSFAGAFSVF